MESFAFLRYPCQREMLTRKYPLTRLVPDRLIDGIFGLLPPLELNRLEIQSGLEAAVLGCPALKEDMSAKQSALQLRKLDRLLRRRGTALLGLPLSLMSRTGGGTALQDLSVAVTNGCACSLAVIPSALQLAAEKLGLAMEQTEIVLCDRISSWGTALVQLLAPRVKHLTLLSADTGRAERLARQIYSTDGLSIRVTERVNSAVGQADIFISIDGYLQEKFTCRDMKSGAVLCDVLGQDCRYQEWAEQREDILVFSEGLLRPPGELNLDAVVSDGLLRTDFAEALLFSLFGQKNGFTIGSYINIRQLRSMDSLLRRSRFKLAALSAYGELISEKKLSAVRTAVGIRQELKAIGRLNTRLS